MKNTAKLGAYIRAVRHLRNMSLPALAKQAGISKGNLSKIENGMGNPQYSTLAKLGEALAIKVAFGELEC